MKKFLADLRRGKPQIYAEKRPARPARLARLARLARPAELATFFR
ncbi:MAG: hypothetical protein WAW07_06600 [Bacteroidales bacterium]